VARVGEELVLGDHLGRARATLLLKNLTVGFAGLFHPRHQHAVLQIVDGLHRVKRGVQRGIITGNVNTMASWHSAVRVSPKTFVSQRAAVTTCSGKRSAMSTI
jgi:hypothetical protein